MPRKPSAKQQLDIAKRRERVSKCIAGGFTIRETSAALGVPRSTVADDKKAILQAVQDSMVDDFKEHFSINLLRLEAAIKHQMPGVFRGKVENVRELVRIVEREAKMLGHDRQTEVAISGALAVKDETERENPVDTIRAAIASLETGDRDGTGGQPKGTR